MHAHKQHKAKQFDRTNSLDGSCAACALAHISQSVTDQPRGASVLLLFTNDSSKNNRYSFRRSLCDVHVYAHPLLALLTDSSSTAFDTAAPRGSLSILIMNPCIYICLCTRYTVQTHTPGFHLTASLKSNVSRKPANNHIKRRNINLWALLSKSNIRVIIISQPASSCL